MGQASYIPLGPGWGAAGGPSRTRESLRLEPSYLTVFAVGQSFEGQHTLIGGVLQLLVPLHRAVLHLHLEV